MNFEFESFFLASMNVLILVFFDTIKVVNNPPKNTPLASNSPNLCVWLKGSAGFYATMTCSVMIKLYILLIILLLFVIFWIIIKIMLLIS
jgi:hypothetical protein